MENYTRYQLTGGPILMKKDVVPHIFNCHPNRNTAKNFQPRAAFEKLNRKRMIADTLEESNKKVKSKENVKNSAPNFQNKEISPKKFKEMYTCHNDIILETATMANEPEINCVTSSQLSEPVNVSIVMKKAVSVLNGNDEREHESTVSVTRFDDRVNIKNPTKKHFRSKAITVKPTTSTAECLAKVDMVNRQCSPIIMPIASSSSESANFINSKSSTSHSEYNPLLEEISELEEEKQFEIKQTALRLTNYFISTDPKNYIGISKHWLWIIEDLQTATKISSDNIKLTLMKIKINDTFRRLGNQFGLCATGASKVFNRSVLKIANVLQTLIHFPDRNCIKKNLPIPFRLNFSNVACIIDCFEIQIEKPSNALHQALTWSDYKKCNTLKYLIGISPDGLIVFISTGYGGRVSDVELFEKCLIMDVLPEKCELMADRGFKQIQTILQKKQIVLVRPPSVLTQQKPSKEEVLLTKQIASLRIHVERVIRRIREYSLLEPHSTLDHNIMPYIDSVVKIVASLINLQNPVIKS